MRNGPVRFKVKLYWHQPTLEEDIGIPNTTPEELARAVLRPVIIEEAPVVPRRQRSKRDVEAP